MTFPFLPPAEALRRLTAKLISTALLVVTCAGVPASASDAISRLVPFAPAADSRDSIPLPATVPSALTTHSRTQFAAFCDTAGHLVLAKRPLGADTWETQRTLHRGLSADSIAAISLAVDGAGHLHVAWQDRDRPFDYARSHEPLSLDLTPPAPLDGPPATHGAHPQLHALPSGDLLLLYRDRNSPHGSIGLKRYETASRRWSTVQPVLLAGGAGQHPEFSLDVDYSGRLHLAWTWFNPSDGSSRDLAYARSVDRGNTWTRTDGTPLSLPLTSSNSEYAARAALATPGPPTLGADREGRPFLCSSWAPEPGAAPQLQILRPDRDAWQIIPGPPAPPATRATVLVDSAWNHAALHLVYHDTASQRLVAATRPGHAPGPAGWTLRVLTNGESPGPELSLDRVLWRRLVQLHVFIPQPANPAPATLIWAPVTHRMRASSAPTHPPSRAAPTPDLDRPLDADAILALAQKAADWQWAHFPPPEHYPPRGWEIAPFYIGVLALDRVSPDRRNRDRMLQQAEALDWQPHEKIYHADDHCVIQAYLELHDHFGEPHMLAPSRERFDRILQHPTAARFDWGTPHCTDHWSWCDALFMAPVAWLQLWKITGDRRYLEFMNREWWIATERLFLPEIGLYLRDEGYLDLREPNGQTIHWSRGNGWVYAGLARVLDLFPEDHADYPRYVQLFRDLTRAVLATQQPDGLWRVGLLDPDTHTERETSGSAFYAYGLAWGLNRGLLDPAAVEPAARRAWHALAESVTPGGRLQHVQPVGAAPEGFAPTHTEIFAVGALLLAASEMIPLAR